MTEEVVKYKTKNAPVKLGQTGIVLSTMDDAVRFAEMVVKSNLCPRGMETAQDVLVTVQAGMEVGMSPMKSIQNIACINSRPCLFGDAPLALVRQSGLLKYITEDMVSSKDDKEARAVCIVLRIGDVDAVTREFSVEDAKRAGLWDKGVWAKYPKRMLQMRARALALRDVFPDVLMGMGIKEELVGIPEEWNDDDQPETDPGKSRTENLAVKMKQADATVEDPPKSFADPVCPAEELTEMIDENANEAIRNATKKKTVKPIEKEKSASAKKSVLKPIETEDKPVGEESQSAVKPRINPLPF